MTNRKWTWISAVILSLCSLATGCQPGGRSGDDQIPAFDDVTVAQLTAAFGSEYSVTQSGPTTALLRPIGDQQVVIKLNHLEDGTVRSLSAHVVGNQQDHDQITDLYADTLETVAQALGVSTQDKFPPYRRVGMLRLKGGYPFNFTQDSIYFDLIPSNPLLETWKWVPFRPDHIKYDLFVTPRNQPSSNPFGPIQGASVEQLSTVLDGFEVLMEIEGEQIVFVRQQEDHRQVVQCMVDDTGGITRIVAFVTDVTGAADANELRTQLWLLLADLEYKQSDPEKVVGFLTGPLANYAVSQSVEVGYATYQLAVGSNGNREEMVIWASQSPQDSL